MKREPRGPALRRRCPGPALVIGQPISHTAPLVSRWHQQKSGTQARSSLPGRVSGSCKRPSSALRDAASGANIAWSRRSIRTRCGCAAGACSLSSHSFPQLLFLLLLLLFFFFLFFYFFFFFSRRTAAACHPKIDRHSRPIRKSFRQRGAHFEPIGVGIRCTSYMVADDICQHTSEQRTVCVCVCVCVNYIILQVWTAVAGGCICTPRSTQDARPKLRKSAVAEVRRRACRSL